MSCFQHLLTIKLKSITVRAHIPRTVTQCGKRATAQSTKESNQVCPKEEQKRNSARHVPAMKYKQIFVTPAAMQPLLLPTSPAAPLPLPKGICPTLLIQTSPPSPSRLLPSLHIVLLVLVPEHWIQSQRSTGKAHCHWAASWALFLIWNRDG